MTWQTPRTWADDEDVTASKLNVHVRDNLSFIYDPPRVVALADQDQAVDFAKWAYIGFGQTIVDTAEFRVIKQAEIASGESADQLFKVRVPGVYLVVVDATFKMDQTATATTVSGVLLSRDISDTPMITPFGADGSRGVRSVGNHQPELTLAGITPVLSDHMMMFTAGNYGVSSGVLFTGNGPTFKAIWLGAGS